MSEVKRVSANWHMEVFYESPHGTHVAVEDYDTLKAERDAMLVLLGEALCHAQRLEPISVSLFNRISGFVDRVEKDCQSEGVTHICKGCGVSGWSGSCNQCMPY